VSRVDVAELAGELETFEDVKRNDGVIGSGEVM
jgi:hypothetical protein